MRHSYSKRASTPTRELLNTCAKMDRTERRNKKIHSYNWEIQSPALGNKKKK